MFVPYPLAIEEKYFGLILEKSQQYGFQCRPQLTVHCVHQLPIDGRQVLAISQL
jgi:hypothetical protein